MSFNILIFLVTDYVKTASANTDLFYGRRCHRYRAEFRRPFTSGCLISRQKRKSKVLIHEITDSPIILAQSCEQVKVCLRH